MNACVPTIALAPPAHTELVERAGRWLGGTRRCGVVLLERGYQGCEEIPDALGYKGSLTVLVEVKVNRADFLSDRHKASRRADTVCGAERWYLTPWGMVDADELPEGWGLLQLRGERIYRVAKAPLRERTPAVYHKELKMLYAHCRRQDLGVT